MGITRNVVVALVGSLATGCALNEFAVLDDNYAPASFDGLHAAQEGSDTVNVLFVHGMGWYAPGDPGPLMEATRKRLGFPEVVDSSNSYPLHHPTTHRLIGRLGHTRYTKSDGRTLQLFVLDWTQAVEVKNDLLEDDRKTEYVDHRLEKMDFARATLFNHSIADVLLYCGQHREDIQEAVTQAIRKLHANAGANPANFAIAFSLGSTIVADTIPIMLSSADTATRQAAVAFKQNWKLFFMLATQLSYLQLCEVPPPPAAPPAPSLSMLMTPGPSPLIIAINDPNDVLGYPIFSAIRDAHPGVFIDVLRSIAKKEVGGLINPAAAHLGYGADECVIDLVLHGYDVVKGRSDSCGG